ncbi:antiterminator Q family protein [Limnobaculum xujianqingii]|uniref:antiterminator Q family protein n=1 Tax=Limnobaculum xujianqingii TaxID=2738837 RepID=UPI00112C3381|nr:antiterminator Q family protein [Limnobaculum xujianqingii]
MHIKTVLEMWGNWARCSCGTEYKKVAPGFQDMKSSSDYTRAECSESDAMKVDSAVSGLRHYDELAYKLVIAHYIYRISQAKLAKQIGKATSYVTGILRVAEAFIAGQLYVNSGDAYATD